METQSLEDVLDHFRDGPVFVISEMTAYCNEITERIILCSRDYKTAVSVAKKLSIPLLLTTSWIDLDAYHDGHLINKIDFRKEEK